MVTADTVTTKSGQTILEKGATLTKSSIMRLSFYNIKEVCVECDDSDTPEPVKEKETPVKQKPSYTPAYSQKVKASQQLQTFSLTILSCSIRLKPASKTMYFRRSHLIQTTF